MKPDTPFTCKCGGAEFWPIRKVQARMPHGLIVLLLWPLAILVAGLDTLWPTDDICCVRCTNRYTWNDNGWHELPR